MNLTNEDVEEIIRLLDASTYTDLAGAAAAA